MDYEKKLREALDSDETDWEIVRWIERTFPELAESEDERIRKWLADYFTEIGENWIHREFTCKQIVAYLEKQKEQKPDDDPLNDPKFLKGFDTGREVQRIFDEKKPAEWSEEDDQLIGFIFDLLNDLVWRKDFAMSKEECLERLKSIRPVKQEWSEEDEKFFRLLHAGLYAMKVNIGKDAYDKAVERLKSLRPSWKPSEEQMAALYTAARESPIIKENGNYLYDLYSDLKKL